MAEVKDVITLNNVRISFMETLWVAGQVQGEGEPSHSANFLLDPDDPQCGALWELVEQVARDKWPKPFGKSGRAEWQVVMEELKAKDKVCIHNGNFKPQYDGYEGMWYVSARNKTKVTVVDRDRSELTPADGKPYSGCYVNVNLQIWAQDHKTWGKRINATLRWVQYFKRGDAFAAAPPANVDEIPAIAEPEEGEEDDAPMM